MISSTPSQKILEHNVKELTEQLYDAYKCIKEQQEEITGLNRIVEALADEASERFKRS